MDSCYKPLKSTVSRIITTALNEVEQITTGLERTQSSNSNAKTNSFTERRFLPKAPLDLDRLELADNHIANLARFAEYLMNVGVFPKQPIKGIWRNQKRILGLRGHTAPEHLRSFSQTLKHMLQNLDQIINHLEQCSQGRNMLLEIVNSGQEIEDYFPPARTLVSEEQALEIAGVKKQVFERYWVKEFPNLIVPDERGYPIRYEQNGRLKTRFSHGHMIDKDLLSLVKEVKQSRRFQKVPC